MLYNSNQSQTRPPFHTKIQKRSKSSAKPNNYNKSPLTQEGKNITEKFSNPNYCNPKISNIEEIRCCSDKVTNITNYQYTKVKETHVRKSTKIARHQSLYPKEGCKEAYQMAD